MPCTSLRTVGFLADGKTISWSPKNFSKEYATFQLPCGGCLECRLDYAKSWAVRCVHEAQMHEKNSFITLTYDDEHLVSPKLIYSDWQKFMKKLRKTQNAPIGAFVTGEYGEKTRRPHWHAIIFNWYPNDATYFRSNDRGDKIFQSVQLDKLWGNGFAEIGAVSYQSAGYVARYNVKKLKFGRDGSHIYDAISKKSSKHAIGKKWLESHWQDIFLYGKIHLPDGTSIGSIPRYYIKWLKENQPDGWLRYVTQIAPEKAAFAQQIIQQDRKEETEINFARKAARPGVYVPPVRTKAEAKAIILKANISRLERKL